MNEPDIDARNRDVDDTVTQHKTWGQRYVGIALLLLGLSIAAVFFASYYQTSYNEVLSFRVDDGWCIKGVESVGQHCFGDYAGVDKGLRAGNLWNPKLPTATAYPPLSMVPGIAFVYLGRATGSWALGRDLYLALLVASLLTPAFWVSRKAWSDRGPIAFLIIGVATAPFLINMDRGNNAALLIAPLLGASIAYVNRRHSEMLGYIVICSVLKPQMLLFALLFIVYRKYVHLVLTTVISVVLTFAGFLFFPGGLHDNVRNWLHMVRGYQTYQGFAVAYPYNLGAGRSILTAFDLSHLESLTGHAARTNLGTWLQSHTGLLSVLLIAMTVGMLFARRDGSDLLYPLLAICILVAIAPTGTSYAYYLVLLLVPVAFIFRDPSLDAAANRGGADWNGMIDAESSGSDEAHWVPVSKYVLVVGLALLLTPLVIPVRSISFFVSQVYPVAPVGLLQLLWGPILIVLFLVTLLLALVPPGRGAPSAALDTALATGTSS